MERIARKNHCSFFLPDISDEVLKTLAAELDPGGVLADVVVRDPRRGSGRESRQRHLSSPGTNVIKPVWLCHNKLVWLGILARFNVSYKAGASYIKACLHVKHNLT